jgi:hypothetical protein
VRVRGARSREPRPAGEGWLSQWPTVAIWGRFVLVPEDAHPQVAEVA